MGFLSNLFGKSNPSNLPVYTQTQINKDNQLPVTNPTAVDSKTNTTTTKTAATSQSTATNSIIFNPTANPLNDYANYTYHIRFFMVSDGDAPYVTVDTVDETAKVIIAESGVTSQFNITSLDITNTIGPGADTQNSTSFSWEMTVVEAYGLSFVDKIYAGASQLGIMNHLQQTAFLDIWFTGYNEDGSIVSDKLFRKVYSVLINDMSFTANEAGTTYNITGVMQSQFGHSDLYSFAQDQCKIVATTVADFFQQLGAVLTKQQYNLVKINSTGGTLPKTTYNFLPPIGSDKWLLQDPKKIIKSNQRNADIDNPSVSSSLVVNIAKGQSFSSIVSYVLSCSIDAVQNVLGRNKKYNLTSNGLSQFYMLHATAKNTAYDTTAKQYIREITYHIVPFITATSVVPDATTKASMITPTVQAAKINELIASGAIAKWYQYIYTGENTEILNFDFSVNNFWSIATSDLDSQIPYDEMTVGPTLAPGTPGYDKLKQPTQTTPPLSVITPSAPITPDKNSGMTTSGQIVHRGNSSSTIENPSSSSQVAQSGGTAGSSQPATATTTSASPGQQAVAAAATQPTPTTPPQPNVDQIVQFGQNNVKSTVLAENLSTLSDAHWPLSLVSTNVPYTTIASQSATANRTDTVTNGQIYPGRGAFGIIAGNLYSGVKSAVSIDLEIRGDPWWLGQSNIEQDLYAATLTIPLTGTVKNDTTTSSSTATQSRRGNTPSPTQNNTSSTGTDPRFANTLSGSNMFLLTFRTGEQINDDTGLMEFKTTSSGYSGFYDVYSVVNHFKDGIFTQTLSCNMDTLSYGATVLTSPPNTSPQTTAQQNQSTTPTAPSAGQNTVAAATPLPAGFKAVQVSGSTAGNYTAYIKS